MKFKSLSNLSRSFLLNFFAVLLVLAYVFLIFWTYCYGLYVGYLLLTAFLACIIIFMFNRNLAQAMKFLLLGALLFLLLSPFNIRQYNSRAENLQLRINRHQELSTREKLGIYGCFLMLTFFDIVPFPEVGQENFYLLFDHHGRAREFHSNAFLRAPSIARAVKTRHRGEITWNKWRYVFNSDFRYILAFNHCSLRVIRKNGENTVALSTYFGYPQNHTTIHASHIFGGIFAFRVDEGLFWYLQQKRWLHPYTAVWLARLP